jgi:hypothetical protein
MKTSFLRLSVGRSGAGHGHPWVAVEKSTNIMGGQCTSHGFEKRF